MTHPDPSDASERSASVRALVRGLQILSLVNREGWATAGEIAKALGMPRPTVYRLLETLEEEGYVTLSASANRWRVTRLAARLGDGYSLISEACRIVGPVFGEWGPRLVWPLDFSVYHDAHMIIQETTHSRSPLSIDRGMMGYHMPLFRTAPGRAYLAFCQDAERETILMQLRRTAGPEDTAYFISGRIEKIIAEAREAGFATRSDGEFRPKTSSIAVPVLFKDQVLGCVSIIWSRSALDMTTAINLYAGPMATIASTIAARLGDTASGGFSEPTPAA